MSFHKNILDIDPAIETDRMVDFLKKEVRGVMRRYGAVVGISGGIDSSTVLALCVKAFGPDRVTAIMMPDKDSDRESEPLARNLAQHFGVDPILEEYLAEAREVGQRDLEIVRARAALDLAGCLHLAEKALKHRADCVAGTQRLVQAVEHFAILTLLDQAVSQQQE